MLLLKRIVLLLKKLSLMNWLSPDRGPTPAPTGVLAGSPWDSSMETGLNGDLRKLRRRARVELAITMGYSTTAALKCYLLMIRYISLY